MRLLRTAIYVLLAFSVLTFGAVEEWSQAVLEVGAAILLVYWSIQLYAKKSEQIVVSPFFLPLTAFALVILAQLVFHSTASNYNTRVELQLLITYLIFIHLINQAFRSGSDYRTLVWFLMSLGFLVSIFGILQYLTSNGKLYWFQQMRESTYFFGPYVNRNHFAGFVELTSSVRARASANGHGSTGTDDDRRFVRVDPDRSSSCSPLRVVEL